MKVRTSITLSQDLLVAVDRLAGRGTNRSAVIEQAVRDFVTVRARRLRNARDLKILDKHAVRLNREASDVLSYQVET